MALRRTVPISSAVFKIQMTGTRGSAPHKRTGEKFYPVLLLFHLYIEGNWILNPWTEQKSVFKSSRRMIGSMKWGEVIEKRRNNGKPIIHAVIFSNENWISEYDHFTTSARLVTSQSTDLNQQISRLEQAKLEIKNEKNDALERWNRRLKPDLVPDWQGERATSFQENRDHAFKEMLKIFQNEYDEYISRFKQKLTFLEKKRLFCHMQAL